MGKFIHSGLRYFALFSALMLIAPVMAEAAPKRVHLVVFRGCEEACMGFKRYFQDRNLPVDIKTTDINRDESLLPALLESIKAEKPDLVVTSGTPISQFLIGTKAKYGSKSALGTIPSLFMIVADPIGADLVDSFQKTGREKVTGVRNRVPEDVQLQTLFSYFFPRTLGVINHPQEFNSTLNTRNLELLSAKMGFKLVALEYSVDAAGKANPNEIPAKMAELKAKGVEAVYVGSSSFNLQHSDAFTAAALEQKLPVFSAYEQMARNSGGLMAVASSYLNVGKLAGARAAEILFEGADPNKMPIANLDRFSIILNMKSAKKLDRYPPIQLITIGEVVK